MRKLLLAVLVVVGLVLWRLPERGPGRGEGVLAEGPDLSVDRAAASLIEPAPAVDVPPETSAREEIRAEDASGDEPVNLGAEVEAPFGGELTLFHGLVLDALTQRPIAGAEIHADAGPIPRDGGEPFPAEALTRTDDAGRFSLSVPEALWRDARLAADGYGPRRIVVDAWHDAPASAAVLELLPEAELEVWVCDAARRPEVGATVKLRQSDSFLFRPQLAGLFPGAHFEQRTDEAGRARFRGLPPESDLSWNVLPAGGEDGRAGHVVLAPGEFRRLEVSVGGGARVFGRVRDEDGAAVAGLGLSLARFDAGAAGAALSKASSDEEGRFSFEDVPFETWTLALLGGEEGFLLRGETRVEVDRPLVELEPVVARGLFIEGEVTGLPEDLESLHSVSVSALDGTWLDHAMLEDRHFRLGPLDPGEYLITAPGFPVGTAVLRVAAGASDVELPALPAERLRVRIEGATGSCETRLVDLERGMTTVRNRRESFELRLSPGHYALTVFAPGDRVGFVALDVGTAPSDEYVVDLERAAACTFVHHAPNGTRTLRVLRDGVPFLAPTWPESILLAGTASTLLVPPHPLVAELLEGARVVARTELAPRPGEHLRVVLEPR